MDPHTCRPQTREGEGVWGKRRSGVQELLFSSEAGLLVISLVGWQKAVGPSQMGGGHMGLYNVILKMECSGDRSSIVLVVCNSPVLCRLNALALSQLLGQLGYGPLVPAGLRMGDKIQVTSNLPCPPFVPCYCSAFLASSAQLHQARAFLVKSSSAWDCSLLNSY